MGDDNSRKRINTKDSCGTCSSSNISLSKYRGLEAALGLFLPCNVFRCLDCNARFWAREGLFANASRVWALILTFVFGLVVAFLFYQPNGGEGGISRKSEFIPQFSSPVKSDVGEDQKLEVKSEGLSSILSSTEVDESLDESLLDGVDTLVQVDQVKNQAEQISNSIQTSINRLESSVEDDQVALMSLLKVDINHAIESWRKSWQSGAVDRYFAHYSSRFTPSDFLPLKEWHEERRSNITSEKGIEVALSEFDVSFEDDNTRAIALFTQSYFSSRYADVSRKRLELINENDEWKIILEREIN